MDDYQELQRKYLEADAIVNDYMDNNELELLTDEFIQEYSDLRKEIILVQCQMNGVEYDFEKHLLNVDHTQVVNVAIVKLLFSYYKLVDTMMKVQELSLTEAKEALEDVIIDDFLAQKFDLNPLNLA